MRKRQFFFLSAAIAVCFTLFFLFWWNESSKASSGSSGSRLRVQVVLKDRTSPRSGVRPAGRSCRGTGDRRAVHDHGAGP